jgi:hypothetical protein
MKQHKELNENRTIEQQSKTKVQNRKPAKMQKYENPETRKASRKAEPQSSKYPWPSSTNDSESFEVRRTPDSHMQFPLLAIVC